jgi:hypothetical protein
MGFFIFCYARKKLCEVLETNVPSALKTIAFKKAPNLWGNLLKGKKKKMRGLGKGFLLSKLFQIYPKT